MTLEQKLEAILEKAVDPLFALKMAWIKQAGDIEEAETRAKNKAHIAESASYLAELANARIAELEAENAALRAADKNSFTQGYVCAVASIARHYDQPTMAREILRCQCSSLKDARAARVDEYDIEPLRKLFDRP